MYEHAKNIARVAPAWSDAAAIGVAAEDR